MINRNRLRTRARFLKLYCSAELPAVQEHSFCEANMDQLRQENSIQHTDVVIIGNGPTAITLSYMLSGHWPHYNPLPAHPDKYLHKRLMQNLSETLVNQDLEFLSDGLEGRSNNPVALLFDTLTHPRADMGSKKLSRLSWTYSRERLVPHVVLGKTLPGGSWHSMDGKTQTLSLSTWMELPEMSFMEFVEEYRRGEIDKLNNNTTDPARATSPPATSSVSGDASSASDASTQSSTASTATSTAPTATSTAPTATSTAPTATSTAPTATSTAPAATSTAPTATSTASTATSTDSSATSTNGGRLQQRPPPKERRSRASASEVAAYYEEYVRRKRLGGRFRSGAHVTSVRSIDHSSYASQSGTRSCVRDAESGEAETVSYEGRVCFAECLARRDSSSSSSSSSSSRSSADEEGVVDKRFEMRGHDEVTGDAFCYHAKYVVLAVGTFDDPQRLRVPGEHLPFVMHTLAEMEEFIDSKRPLPDSPLRRLSLSGGCAQNPDSRRRAASEIRQGGGGSSSVKESAPLLVVGAGLSAADAVLTALAQDVPVVHAFRRPASDPALMLNTLPKSIYPEYHRVQQLMSKKLEDCHYIPYAEHKVLAIRSDKTVLLEQVRTGLATIVQVRAVVATIGSSPSLSFLPGEGRHLAARGDQPVHPKHNPVAVDPYSYQCRREPRMFAVGPLVGDNFVRFGRGAALGITQHLWRRRTKQLKS